jgi:hypothetical protein
MKVREGCSVGFIGHNLDYGWQYAVRQCAEIQESRAKSQEQTILHANSCLSQNQKQELLLTVHCILHTDF